jgi:hypothetical protein
MNLQCVPSKPRRLKDRIVELEAHLKQISSQSEQESQTESSSPSKHPSDAVEGLLEFLDCRVPRELQQQALYAYVKGAEAAWPAVPLAVSDLEITRNETPILLLCILAFPIPASLIGVDNQVQDELVGQAISLLPTAVLTKGQRSMELVQCLLVTSFWVRNARGQANGSCHQFVQLAVDMAIDLGLGGPQMPTSPGAYFSRMVEVNTIDASRTWLACFIAAVSQALCMRRPMSILWTTYHDTCAMRLLESARETDHLLCCISTLFKVCQEIAIGLDLCNAYIFRNIQDAETIAAMGSLREKLQLWENHMPPALTAHPVLLFWKQVVLQYLFELVLHTPTNKASFAAPFVPERLAAADFPAPASLKQHAVAAFKQLIGSSHTAIDICLGIDAHLLLDMPSLCFTPAVMYSFCTLLRAYITLAGPGNTYGALLDKDMLRLGDTFERLNMLATRLRSLDPSSKSYTTMMISAVSWLETWFVDYSGIVSRFDQLQGTAP